MKLAIICSGWHFASQFYEAVAKQKKPEGWDIDLFCVSHRDPKHAKKEKKSKVFTGNRAHLDEKLYRKILSVKDWW